MRNMKVLLRLLGAVSLSTVAVSSVVACGTKTPEEHVDAAKLLGWYGADGKSLIEQKLNYDNTAGNEKYSVTVDSSLITIPGLFKNKLLVTNDIKEPKRYQAKSIESANFLKELGFTSGNESKNYSDTDVTSIIALTAKVASSTTGKIEKNGTTDFKVSDGTCQIEVKNNTTVLKVFNIKTKESNLLIPDSVSKIIQKSAEAWNITFEGTNAYKQGQRVIRELPWNSDDTGQKAKKQFDELYKLLNINGRSLLWSSDNQGKQIIDTYTNTSAFLTIKFTEVKVWGPNDCGIPSV